MKKSVLIVAILLLCRFIAGAQFFNAIGIAAGISYNKEGWTAEEYATQEHYLFGLNGAVLAEFVDNRTYKWRSEIMYNQLGTKEYVGEGKYINHMNYFSFNNYLKIQHEFFDFTPYFLIGPRIAYLFSRSAEVFPDVIGGMYSFHVSGAVGVGVEKVCYSRFKPFIEFFYNHDLMPSFVGNISSLGPNPPLGGVVTTIMQHDFELRIGVKYHLMPTSKCPAVINPAGT